MGTAGTASRHLTLAVTWAVLGAALLHASWNAAVHRIKDRLAGFVLIGAATIVVCACVLPWVAAPARAAWPFLAASVAAHGIYNVMLMRSYQLGDFNQMYPLARGMSPWVVAIGAAVFVGESLSPVHLAGVVVVSAGLAVITFAGGRPRRAQLPALGAAVATGLAIATYTLLDGVGVRRSGSTLGYAGWLLLFESMVVPAGALAVRGRRLLADCRPFAVRGLLAGVASAVAYAIIIWAQTRAPLASVAALRETSIVFGSLIAVLLFRERLGLPRFVGALVTTAGIVLLNV